MYTVRGDQGGPPGSQGRATPEQQGDAQGGGYSGGGDGGDDKGRSVWTHAEDTVILEGVATVGRPQHRLHRLHRLHHLHRLALLAPLHSWHS